MNGFREADRILYGPEEIRDAKEAVRRRSRLEPRVALILGSGLGGLADDLDEAVAIDYSELPGFPRPTVEGHEGKLVLGRIEGTPVVAQQGRFHIYEGHSAAQVTFPLRVMYALGARILVVTNAAGGVDHRLGPGDFMVIEDHINFQFRSPLRGSGPLVDEDRFVDLSEPYSKRLIAAALDTAGQLGITRVRTGTYFGETGPSYETPAEIRMARKLGGDAVGMSTVPEVVAARHMDMEVLGIACISNRAAGMAAAPLSHDEVIEVTKRVGGTFRRYLKALVPALANHKQDDLA